MIKGNKTAGNNPNGEEHCQKHDRVDKHSVLNMLKDKVVRIVLLTGAS